MKNQKIKENFEKVKVYVVEMPKKKKILVGSIAGAIIIFAIVLTIILNMNQNDGYKTLYSNLDSQESTQIYQALVEMGAKPKMNEKGEVMVLAEEYDIWLLQLAGKGYPNSAMPYDLFSNHSGMTATESDKQQWLVYQTQDRLQGTLKKINGVKDAVVNITMPEKTDYVWQEMQNKERPTASVLLTFSYDKSVNEQQVSAIKSLVAASIPQMTPEDVTVVDSQTGVELVTGNGNTGSLTYEQNLQFEQKVQKQLEDNIQKILKPFYGDEGVVAVAKVTLNYDAMMTEQKELIEKEGGGGYLTHSDEHYTINGEQAAGGIVGEEDNTDMPDYIYDDPNQEGGATDIDRTHDYDYGYIKTQIEKGNAKIESSSVSVMVKDPNFTQDKQEELVSLISKSAGIAPEDISVSTFAPQITDNGTNNNNPIDNWNWSAIPMWLYITVFVLILIAVILIFVLVFIRRKQKQAVMQEELELEEKRKSLENEINQYKQQLSDAAKSATDPKNDAIMDEVKSFAKENPEITANLLRSWLKEDAE